MKSKLLWCAIGLTIICPMILGYFRADRNGSSVGALTEGPPVDSSCPEKDHFWGFTINGEWWGVAEIDRYSPVGGGIVWSMTWMYTGVSCPEPIYLRAYQVVLIGGAPLALWGWVLVRCIVRRLRRR